MVVYDALGRQVGVAHEGLLEVGRHAVRLPVSGLAPGVYVVRVERSGMASTRRLTVAG